MEQKANDNGQSTTGKPLKRPLFGEPTPARAAGVSYTLSAVLPSLLSLVFLMTIAVAGLTKTEGYTTSDWYLYVSYLLPQISFAVIAVFWLRYTKTPVREAVRSQKCDWKYFIVAMLLQIGLLSLSELNSLFLKFLARFGYKDMGISLPSMDGFGFVGVLIVVAVFPAIFEELFFRGVLLSGMKSFKTTGAVLLCGALFSLYHQNPAQTIYQFCCGAAFALVAIKSGSILPTVLSHFANNAFILVLEKTGISSFSTPVFWTIMGVSVVCLIASLVYLLFLDKKQTNEPPMYESEGKNDPVSERKRFFLGAALGIALCAFTWLFVLFTGM